VSEFLYARSPQPADQKRRKHRPWHIVREVRAGGLARTLCQSTLSPDAEVRRSADMGPADRMDLCVPCAKSERLHVKKAAGLPAWETPYRTTLPCPHCTAPLLSAVSALNARPDLYGRRVERLRCRDCARRFRLEGDRLLYVGRGDRPHA
jgi:hypothetical protein